MTTTTAITNLLLIGGSFAAFAILHSLIAGTGTRDRLAARLGAQMVHGLYRMSYNLIAVVTLIIPLVLVVILPDQTLYHVEAPLSYLLLGIQAVGVIGAGVTLLQTDLLGFAGVRQVISLVRGEGVSNHHAALQTGGLYRWMRHPLYVFSLMVIWAMPVMSVNWLIFNVAATLYFLIGAIFEERRLERAFGDEYREYKQQVGWIGRRG